MHIVYKYHLILILDEFAIWFTNITSPYVTLLMNMSSDNPNIMNDGLADEPLP
jgi:hypothetical protein